MSRNYAQESAAHKDPAYLKANASRKKARRIMEKAGLVKKFDGREVDHKNLKPNDDRRSNLQVLSKTANRSKQPKHK